MGNNDLLIIGSSSNLSSRIEERLESEFKVSKYGRASSNDKVIDASNLSNENIAYVFEEHFDFYIFNLGFLQSKRILEQSEQEILLSFKINALFTIKSCEYIFSRNKSARVIIIGSESGKKGSFDTSYFLSKSMLNSYVKERRLNAPGQQLLLISPSTIADSQMTMRRKDTCRLNHYRQEHPKKRFLDNDEVVSIIYSIVTNDSTYLTNTEIEINGGKFARMKY